MKIEDIKILGTEFNEERVHILKYFLREKHFRPFLTQDSSGNMFMNFISNRFDDYGEEHRNEQDRERTLITFDEFVKLFNVNTKPEIIYEYYYVFDEKEKSIVQIKEEI